MDNIILIGMPWVGKSRVGRLLAKKLNKPFLDTDEYILTTTGKDVAEHFWDLSPEESLKREIELISEIEIYSSIIAISGSLPITKAGKELIQEWWKMIIKLEAPLEIIKSRIYERPDGDSRIIFWEHKSIDSLLNEREKHFDAITTHLIQCNKSPDEVIDDIIRLIENN